MGGMPSGRSAASRTASRESGCSSEAWRQGDTPPVIYHHVVAIPVSLRKDQSRLCQGEVDVSYLVKAIAYTRFYVVYSLNHEFIVL